MSDALLRSIDDGGLVFDGAMGSMLIARGLEPGRSPESWNRERPDVVRSVHTAYLGAGARVVTTNTFGGTPPRLEAGGLGADALSVNADGVRLAREAVTAHGTGAFVALSVGPTGLSLPPVGDATPSDIAAAYEAQMRAAAAAGVPDLVLVETMYDVREAEVALERARATFPGLPVAVTFALGATPRGFHTIMGNAAADATRRMRSLGAALTGANCALASADMLALARALRADDDSPLLCQPNAGAPRLAGNEVVYDQSPEQFAADVRQMLRAGVAAVGGCCGTTPEFIAAILSREEPS